MFVINEPNQRWGPVSSAQLVFTEIRYTRKKADEFKGANFRKNLKIWIALN